MSRELTGLAHLKHEGLHTSGKAVSPCSPNIVFITWLVGIDGLQTSCDKKLRLPYVTMLGCAVMPLHMQTNSLLIPCKLMQRDMRLPCFMLVAAVKHMELRYVCGVA